VKKYPEDAMKVFNACAEHFKRTERILDLFIKEQERVYLKLTALMENMAEETTETETGGLS